MSYAEYIDKLCLRDCRRSWIDWKVDICGMSEREAIKAAYDTECGFPAVRKLHSNV